LLFLLLQDVGWTVCNQRCCLLVFVWSSGFVWLLLMRNEKMHYKIILVS
jgi:hypothetical protein